MGGLISEDKLQNLALFSEYGRLALEPVKKRKVKIIIEVATMLVFHPFIGHEFSMTSLLILYEEREKRRESNVSPLMR